MSGKEKLTVFGDYPSISLAQARQARDVARSHVANGTGPWDARKQKAFLECETRAETCELGAVTDLARITNEGCAAATLAKCGWMPGIVNADMGRKPIAESRVTITSATSGPGTASVQRA